MLCKCRLSDNTQHSFELLLHSPAAHVTDVSVRKIAMENIYFQRKNEQFVVEYQSFWKLSPVLNSVLYIIPGSEFGEHHFLHRLIWGIQIKRDIA